MKKAVTVRSCTSDDIPALRLHEPPNSAVAEGFLERQSAGDLIYATAWSGATPCGGAVLDFRAGPAPELKHLFVYAGNRGAGVGKALCLWLEEQARLAGHRRIHLGVEPGSTCAVRLYRGLGYLTTGEGSTTSYEYVDAAGNRNLAPESVEVFYKDLTVTAAG